MQSYFADFLLRAVAIVGATANNGANVGRFYANWNNSAASGNWNISALHLFPARPYRCAGHCKALPLGKN